MTPTIRSAIEQERHAEKAMLEDARRPLSVNIQPSPPKFHVYQRAMQPAMLQGFKAWQLWGSFETFEKAEAWLTGRVRQGFDLLHRDRRIVVIVHEDPPLYLFGAPLAWRQISRWQASTGKWSRPLEPIESATSEANKSRRLERRADRQGVALRRDDGTRQTFSRLLEEIQGVNR